MKNKYLNNKHNNIPKKATCSLVNTLVDYIENN